MSEPASSSTRSTRSICRAGRLSRPAIRATATSARRVIIATGAQARWLGVPGEAAFRGFGVSACATCDGFFFRDKEVIVVGGGNTAVEEAIYLTNHARRVTLVHRRDQLRAEKILQDRLFRNPKIDIVWDSVVEEIVGIPEPPEVTGVRLRNLRTGAVTERACDGVFVAIGHTPVTELVAGPAAARSRRLHPDRAGFDGDRDPRRVRRRRRQGQGIPAGGDGRRSRLHGRARGGEVYRRAGGRRGGARRRIATAGEDAEQGLPGARPWRWIGTSCGCFTRSPRRAASPMPARRSISASRRSAGRSARSRRASACRCSTGTRAD